MTKTCFCRVSVDFQGWGAWMEKKLWFQLIIKTLILCPRYTYTYWKGATLRQEAWHITDTQQMFVEWLLMNNDLQRSLELPSHLGCFNTDLELRAKTAAAFYLSYQIICPELVSLLGWTGQTHSVTQVTPEKPLNFAHRQHVASMLPWSHREQNWTQMNIGSSFKNGGKKCWWLPSPDSNYTTKSLRKEETFCHRHTSQLIWNPAQFHLITCALPEAMRKVPKN